MAKYGKSKSKVRIYVKKGGLKGYKVRDPLDKKRAALKRLVKQYGYSTIIKRLNVIGIYNKNRYPEITKKVRSDMAYLRKEFNRPMIKRQRTITTRRKRY